MRQFKAKHIPLAMALLGLLVFSKKIYATASAGIRAAFVQMSQQSSNPISGSNAGVFVDNAGTPQLHFFDGTNNNLVSAVAATTKGDLSAYTGSNWGKLAAGTNGQCLTAQSGQTTGLQWASCGGGGGSGTVTSIVAGTGLSGGTITTTGTISMPNTGPGSGTIGGGTAYINSVTLDAQGRVTAAATGTPAPTLAQAYANGSAGPQVFAEDGTKLEVAFKGYSLTQNALAIQNPSGSTNSYFLGDGTLTVQPSAASIGSQTAVSFIPATNSTNYTASSENLDISFDLSHTATWATGTITTQEAMKIAAPTYAFVGNSTITNAATLSISGAPIAGAHATITNPYAILVGGGAAIGSSGQLLLSSTQASGATPAIVLNANAAWTNANPAIEFQRNGTKILDIDTGGSDITMNIYNGSGAFLNGLYFDSGANIQFNRSSGDFLPSSTSNNLGHTGAVWGAVWANQHMTTTQTVADAASITVNPASGEDVRITLGSTAITTVTFSSGIAGEILTIEVIQDGTGSRAISGFTSNVKFAGGAAPTWTTTASKRDLVTFRYDLTDTNWYEMSRSLNM